MLNHFKEEYFWMLRESKGYIPWLNEYGHHLRRFFHNKRECDFCVDYNSRDLIKTIAVDGIFDNDLLNLISKSLMRAEIRLVSRYIPQRSHEERLTGSLVSEIDNSFSMMKPFFRETALKLYAEHKEIDFLYYDLSRGGKLEKQTGADLALIVCIDLPDMPKIVKSLILQAKKVNGSTAQINKEQFEAIIKQQNSAYLFYDMNLNTLCPPFILKTEDDSFEDKYKECVRNGNDSFGMDFGKIQRNGMPLALFLLISFLNDDVGESFKSFQDAFQNILQLSSYSNGNGLSSVSPSSRVAIMSFGKKIEYGVQGEGFHVDIR